MVYEWTMRKKRFDEEGSEVLPAKNRPSKLKERMQIPEATVKDQTDPSRTPLAPSAISGMKVDPLKGQTGEIDFLREKSSIS